MSGLTNGGQVFTFTLPQCKVCSKYKVMKPSDVWGQLKYVCPDGCDDNISVDIEPQQEPAKIPCNCDLYSVIMVTGCLNKNHY